MIVLPAIIAVWCYCVGCALVRRGLATLAVLAWRRVPKNRRRAARHGVGKTAKRTDA